MLIIIKHCLNSSNKVVQLVAIANVFKLFEAFANTKNKVAPTVYMTIVVCLISTNNSELRDNYLTNFKRVFTVNKAIPVKIMMEPLLKLYS